MLTLTPSLLLCRCSHGEPTTKQTKNMNKYDMEKLDDLKETGDMAFLDSVPVTVVKLADCYEVRQNYSLHRTFYSSLAEVKRLIVSLYR